MENDYKVVNCNRHLHWQHHSSTHKSESLNYSSNNSNSSVFLLQSVFIVVTNQVPFEVGPSQYKTSPPPKTFLQPVASEWTKAKQPRPWRSSLWSIFLLQTKHHGVAGQGECNKNDITFFSILKFMRSPCKVQRGDKRWHLLKRSEASLQVHPFPIVTH